MSYFQLARLFWRTCSARAEMTFPSVVRLLLMLAPSLSLVPLAPVDSALSDPAKSTRDTLLTWEGQKSSIQLHILYNFVRQNFYFFRGQSRGLVVGVLCEYDGEDRVGAGGRLVHGSRRNSSGWRRGT